jgi:predicted phosphohydrolase
MLIAYTSDIHSDCGKENNDIPQKILTIMEKRMPDVFIIAGDISHQVEDVNKALGVFKDLPCHKFFVPGNHDIWIEHTYRNSFDKYLSILPEAAQENNFIPLWMHPSIINDIGFCGSMGWYDYSFRSSRFHFSDEQCANKQFWGLTWTDRTYACFFNDDKKLTDHEVTQLLYTDFSAHIASIYDNVHQIIAVFHHLPFRKMVLYRNIPHWDFFSAYMGAARFGDYLIEKNKVKLVIAGHSHRKQSINIPYRVQQGSLHAVTSPFGYFLKEGLRPLSRWYRERLSYIDI